jgi:hypothetical protein
MSSLKIEGAKAQQRTVPCIKLKSPDGAIRLIRSGEPYRLLPGEKIDGVDRTCGGTQVTPTATRKTRSALVQELDEAVGGGLGDWIKVMARPLANMVGKDRCTPCEARRIATNAYAQLKGKYGQLEALRIIKDLWTLSFKGEPEQVLLELKKYL